MLNVVKSCLVPPEGSRVRINIPMQHVMQHTLPSNSICFPCYFQVHAGWVLDTDVFNEWMNEEDYCVDERNSPLILRQRVRLQDEQVCGCLRDAFWS